MDSAAEQWSAVGREVALGAAVTAVLLLAALRADAPGRILCLAGALLLGLTTLRDGVLRPTLVVDAAGVSIRNGRTLHRIAWSELGPVTATTSRRLVTQRSMEIEAGDRLFVLAARRLGAEPAAVAAAVERHRPGSAGE